MACGAPECVRPRGDRIVLEYRGAAQRAAGALLTMAMLAKAILAALAVPSYCYHTGSTRYSLLTAPLTYYAAAPRDLGCDLRPGAGGTARAVLQWVAAAGRDDSRGGCG